MTKTFFLLVVIPILVLPYSPGETPFDWSDQWGVSHRYGFSGWGMNSYQTPLHFDGNFIQWSRRYQFPFPSEPEDFNEDHQLLASFNYRQGDYNLDELSFDILSRPSLTRYTRFRALKRNFEDHHGMLDLAARPGGTIQQNYRLDSESMDDKGGHWKIATAVYLTTGGIPVWNQLVWDRGAERRDKIAQAGFGYSGKSGSVKYHIKGSTFLQRFRNRTELEGVTTWSGDIFSNRFHAVGELPIHKRLSIFISSTRRSKAFSSKSLGNQSLKYSNILGGIRIRGLAFDNRVGIGLSAVSGGVVSTNFQGHFKLKLGKNQIFLDVIHDLQPLPFQFTSRPYKYVPDYFTPSMIAKIRPDSSAIVPSHTLIKSGVLTHGKKASFEGLLFVSQRSPLHYFQRLTQLEDMSSLSLTSTQISRVSGLVWIGKVNYFRDWAITTRGTSLFDSGPGWEHFFRHDSEVSLNFREKIFKEKMDARLNIIYNIWDGRTAYDWDPILNMGYTYDKPPDVQEAMGIFTAEFKVIIQSIEFSYTIKNLQYSIESASGKNSNRTFSPSLLFPPAQRLAFLSIAWKLAN